MPADGRAVEPADRRAALQAARLADVRREDARRAAIVPTDRVGRSVPTARDATPARATARPRDRIARSLRVAATGLHGRSPATFPSRTRTPALTPVRRRDRVARSDRSFRAADRGSFAVGRELLSRKGVQGPRSDRSSEPLCLSRSLRSSSS